MVSKRRSRARRGCRRGLVVGMGLALSVSASAVAAPLERAFEMVSPPDKGGYPVIYTEAGVKAGDSRLSVDGNTAIYSSFGLFAGAQSGMPQTYRAVRASGEWTTSVASPRTVVATPDAASGYGNLWTAATPDLRFGLVKTRDDLDRAGPADSIDLFRSTTDGQVVLLSVGDGGERLPEGSGPSPDGSEVISDDGDRAFFSTDEHIDGADASRVVGTDVYERRDGRTILLNQNGSGGLLSKCGSALGGTNWIIPVTTTRNAVSSDARSVIFSVPSGVFDFSDPDCLSPTRIFMKSETQGLIEISASEASVADAPQVAVYQGAATDGSRVYFTTSERLIDGVAGGGLYVYNVGGPRGARLRLAVESGDISVVKTSDDGSSVYFTSTTQPAPGSRTGGSALYVFRETDSGSTVRWIADDELGDFASALTALQENARRANISRNGMTLVFESAASLTGFDAMNPATGAPATQLYVYDDRVGLQCASCDPAGQRPPDAPISGNASIGPGEAARTVTDDGTTVFFSSPDRLVSGDQNSKRDVYQFSEGRVSLISSGRGRTDASLVDASTSGDTVLFSTAESLVPQDDDGGDLDMYVARVGGTPPGQRIPRVPGVGCEDDGCQGPANARVDDAVPGSTGLETEPPVDEAVRVAPSARIMEVGRQQLRSLARRGRASLNVRATGAGTLRVVAEARIGGRVRIVARGSARSRREKSTVRVTVSLSRLARRALAQRRSLAVRISARFPNQTRAAVVTVVLRAVASPRGGRR